MPVTSITAAAAMTPAQPSRAIPGPQPSKIITAAPFTPAAQKQANVINAGGVPQRGSKLDTSSDSAPAAKSSSAPAARGSKVDIKV